MDANKILQADFLDIIFEGRNKEYGAYQLRKTYARRLAIAFVSMIAILLLGFLISSLLSKIKPAEETQMVVNDVELTNVKKQEEEKKPEVAPPPPPPKQEVPKVEMKKFTPPKFVEDEQVKEPPPEMKELKDVKIGNINVAGVKDVGVVGPTLLQEPKTTVDPGPKQVVEDYDKEFKTVQIQAKFPGGEAEWRKFLERNLNRDLPIENGAPSGSYRVTVSFLVDKDGNISEVVAENDPGYGTAAEAVRVIKKGPKWTPAVQNGRNVIYRQRQQIVFQVSEGE